MKRPRIVGLGMSVPERIVTNADLEKMVETSDEWITARTGIKERRIAPPGTTASQLALPAVRQALDAAGVAPEELDLIICATSTPDRMFPATACLIQREIGAAPCPAFDLSAACSGFVYGLTVARQFMAAGECERALVVGTEVLSRYVDWEDRSTCVLFGDGAGAAVLTVDREGHGIIDSRIYADGQYHDFLASGPGTAVDPADPKGECLTMKGNQTFKVAVTNMAKVAREMLDENGLTPGDIDLVVPHQANYRIINAVGEKLGIPAERLYINVNRYGNTSAATIPMALCEAQGEGRIKPGDRVLLVAFGGGFTWGATLLRW